MDDKTIVALYWERSENAIVETDNKYGKYCHTVAYNILSSHEDAKECVNDTYLRAWNAMPPHKPSCLSAFLGKITRNLALDRLMKQKAKKRAGNTLPILEEIAETLPSEGKDTLTDGIALKDALNAFLSSLPKETRVVFIQRYFFFDSIKEIAEALGMTESNVKVILHRTRHLLKDYLIQEGISL